MPEATTNRRGRITIPAHVRKVMGLGAGDRVVFTCLPGGTTIMRGKTRSILDLQGMLQPESSTLPLPTAAMRIGRS